MSVVRKFASGLKAILRARTRALLSIAAMVLSMVAVVGVQQASAASASPMAASPGGGASDATITFGNGSVATIRVLSPRTTVLVAAGTVTGTVADFDGVPIAGAVVSVASASDDVVGTATTGATGDYTVGGLAGGTFAVSFSHAPQHASVVVRGVTVSANGTTQVNLVLAAATTGAVTGTVTGGGPLAGVAVSVFGSAGNTAGTATTAADGTYTVGNVAPGTYTVCFNGAAATGGSSTTGYVSACSTGVAVVAAAGSTADKELTAGPAGSTCAPGKFEDVTPLFCNDISWLVSKGITQGTSTTTYSGGNNVTREQMAMFLYRMGTGTVNVVPPCTGGQPYDDVPTGMMACGSIEWAKTNSVMVGTDATHFAPGEPMTRESMVVALYALTHPGATIAPACTAATPFVDVAQGDASCGAVMWAYDHTVTKGTDATHFSPASPVTRDQMAAFLHRTYNITQISGTASALGAGVAGVSVIVTGTGATTASYSAVTGADGKYVVPGVDAGTYTVCFDASAATGGPFVYQCYNNVVGGGSPTTVTVAKWVGSTADAALTTAP